MIREEFTRITAKLESCFNKRLNDIQLDVWFDELKYYEADKYERAVRKLIATSQYSPTLSAVLNAVRTVKDAEVFEKEKVPCKACKGTGYVLYNKIVDGISYQYACQCNCKNGIGLDYDGTKIGDKEHRSPYYLAKAEDVFLKKDYMNKVSNAEGIDYDISQINF